MASVADLALNGRVTILTGSLLPSQLETLPARKLIGLIRFCTLDWAWPTSPARGDGSASGCPSTSSGAVASRIAWAGPDRLGPAGLVGRGLFGGPLCRVSSFLPADPLCFTPAAIEFFMIVCCCR